MGWTDRIAQEGNRSLSWRPHYLSSEGLATCIRILGQSEDTDDLFLEVELDVLDRWKQWQTILLPIRLPLINIRSFSSSTGMFSMFSMSLLLTLLPLPSLPKMTSTQRFARQRRMAALLRSRTFWTMVVGILRWDVLSQYCTVFVRFLSQRRHGVMMIALWIEQHVIYFWMGMRRNQVCVNPTVYIYEQVYPPLIVLLYNLFTVLK